MLRNGVGYLKTVDNEEVLIPSYRSMLRNKSPRNRLPLTMMSLNPFLQVNA